MRQCQCPTSAPPWPCVGLLEVSSFLLALGQVARVPMPAAEAALTLLEVFSGKRLRGNAVLAELDPRTLARQLLLGAAA